MFNELFFIEYSIKQIIYFINGRLQNVTKVILTFYTIIAPKHVNNVNNKLSLQRLWPIPCTSGNPPAFRVRGACGSKQSVHVQRVHVRALTNMSAPSPRCLRCDVAPSPAIPTPSEAQA